jgi:hypothetical protein
MAKWRLSQSDVLLMKRASASAAVYLTLTSKAHNNQHQTTATVEQEQLQHSSHSWDYSDIMVITACTATIPALLLPLHKFETH